MVNPMKKTIVYRCFISWFLVLIGRSKHPFFCFQTTPYNSLMCLSRAKTMSRARGGGHTTPEKPKAKGWMLELHGRDMN